MTVPLSGPPKRLASTHEARQAFADCNGLYYSASEGLSAFNDVLKGWGFHLDHEDLLNRSYWDNASRVHIYDDQGNEFGYAYFEWDYVGDRVEVRGRIGQHATRRRSA